MGHGYGLDHARRDGSSDDYQDPWDVMSTEAWPWMEEPDTDFTDIGPGLNACCMRSRSWLDENRVWSSAAAFDTIITLRPLHRRDLSGFLAAQLGEYLVEFRVPQSWDGAIGEPTVLVHRFSDNHSYLMAATNGQQALTTGLVFEAGRADWIFHPHSRLEVVSIDSASHTATVRLTHRPVSLTPRVPDLVGQLIGGIEAGGGGIVILPGGQIKHVPPRGPSTELVRLASQFADHELTGDIALGIAERRSMLRSIVALCEHLYEDNDVVSTSPKRLKARSPERGSHSR
jgi:hypothetical protein